MFHKIQKWTPQREFNDKTKSFSFEVLLKIEQDHSV